MRNKLCLRKVCFNCLFHFPIDIFNLIVGCNCIHRAEALRYIHHISRIEERYLFFPPFLAVLAAQILRSVFAKGFKKNFHFKVSHFFNALNGDIHKRAFLFNADNLLNKRCGFRLVIQAHYRWLELLKQLATCIKRVRHIMEQKSSELTRFGLVINTHLRLRHNAERSLRANENLIKVGTCRMLWRRRCFDNIAVRKHNLHPEHHIVDFPVLCGGHSDASVCKEPTHGRTCERGRIVHRCISSFVCRPLDVLVYSARTAFYVHALFVYVINFIHSLCVENNSSANGNGAALCSAARAPCCNGDFIVVCNFNNCGNLFCVLWRNNKIALRHAKTTVCPHS